MLWFDIIGWWLVDFIAYAWAYLHRHDNKYLNVLYHEECKYWQTLMWKTWWNGDNFTIRKVLLTISYFTHIWFWVEHSHVFINILYPHCFIFVSCCIVYISHGYSNSHHALISVQNQSVRLCASVYCLDIRGLPVKWFVLLLLLLLNTSILLSLLFFLPFW
jgi:hypothetical protein